METDQSNITNYLVTKTIRIRLTKGETGFNLIFNNKKNA